MLLFELVGGVAAGVCHQLRYAAPQRLRRLSTLFALRNIVKIIQYVACNILNLFNFGLS